METFISQLATGEITWATGAAMVALATVVGAIGGALGGLKIGGEHIGKQTAMMMGAFFGPLAALPGVLIGLIVLKLI
jgi:hypothetical protein